MGERPSRENLPLRRVAIIDQHPASPIGLRPLGSASTTLEEALAHNEGYATDHAQLAAKVIEARYPSIDPVRPSGTMLEQLKELLVRIRAGERFDAVVIPMGLGFNLPTGPGLNGRRSFESMGDFDLDDANELVARHRRSEGLPELDEPITLSNFWDRRGEIRTALRAEKGEAFVEVTEILDCCEEIIAAGVDVAAAGGNEGSERGNVLTLVPGLTVVGALTADGDRAPYSSALVTQWSQGDFPLRPGRAGWSLLGDDVPDFPMGPETRLTSQPVAVFWNTNTNPRLDDAVQGTSFAAPSWVAERFMARRDEPRSTELVGL